MQIKTRNYALAVTTLIASMLISGPTIAADAGADESRVVITENRGRPPFKRARISTDAEFARFEAAADAAPVTRPADFRGRPPFTRQATDSAEASEAEFARFEESSEQKNRRRGPPGKLTSRR